jgi:2-polyprenyl-6-methoxyphenol hydroxylase-like FAD-dependent oxidoreductase
MTEQRFDVCVVGAGAAGTVCAQGLARQGHSVLLLERLHPMPPCLKAEKIGGEGVPPLLRLGFQAAVDASLTPLHNVAVFFGERHLGTLNLDVPEAGALYYVLVNNLREHLDARIDFRPGVKAETFEQQPDGVVVVTDQGDRLACRLVVIATGDAHHLLESLGGSYELQPPHQTFVAAFTMNGTLDDGQAPVDTKTYHRPVKGGPVAYATFFRLGAALRANIFCPGPIDEKWQHDLKQRPLEALSERSRLIAEAARSWEITTPVMIRKMQVVRLRPPAVPRIVVLGDAAHTIDPSGGGGLTFALMETELLLDIYASRWLREDDCSADAIQTFYADPRRTEAVQHYFGRGQYIYALNHDASLRGQWRRIRFALEHLTSPQRSRRGRETTISGPAWRLPSPHLYEE